MGTENCDSQVDLLRDMRPITGVTFINPDKSKTPMYFKIHVNIKMEGQLLTGSYERNWILRIAIGLVGALTLGSGMTWKAIYTIGVDLGKVLTSKVIHEEATASGKGPTCKINVHYNVITFFEVTPTLLKTKSMEEHLMLSGLCGDPAFLSVKADIGMMKFPLCQRNNLLYSCRQLLNTDLSGLDLPDLNFQVNEFTPASAFKSILMMSFIKEEEEP